jgi:Zn-dependent M28 family amino/carboxypeptidase
MKTLGGIVDSIVMSSFLRRLRRVVFAVLAVLAVILGLAAVAITQPTFGNSSAPALASANPERLRRHVEFLTVATSPRDSDHPENLEKAAAYIKEQLSLAGARVRDQEFTVRGRTYRNVIASFGPEAGPLLVVGAHYDSFGDFGPNPGADDNASGTAGLLELARLLAGRHLRHRVELVAYANEEPPWFGSPWMGSAVHARSLKGQDVRAMICLEMIGYFTEKQPAPNWLFRLLYPDRGDFIVVAGRWSDRILTRHVKRAIGSTGFPTHSFTAPRDAGIDASDQRSYWDVGIPAVMVTDTAFVRNPHYHTAGDTAETLDYGRMAQVVEGVATAGLLFDVLQANP